ncbi:hypothetical protein LI328DRAFT_66261 [Trichoderma asperelloides]|nr:hypothetical protein LI328DRAFT_66261 [Trichoderma asperelloides]
MRPFLSAHIYVHTVSLIFFIIFLFCFLLLFHTPAVLSKLSGYALFAYLLAAAPISDSSSLGASGVTASNDFLASLLSNFEIFLLPKLFLFLLELLLCFFY